VTETHVCEQLAQGCHPTVKKPGLELASVVETPGAPRRPPAHGLPAVHRPAASQPERFWWRGTVVERRSLAGELSLSCARPAADG